MQKRRLIWLSYTTSAVLAAFSGCSSAPASGPAPARATPATTRGTAPVNFASPKPSAQTVMCIVKNIEAQYGEMKPEVVDGEPVVIHVNSGEIGTASVVEVESFPGGSAATIWVSDRYPRRSTMALRLMQSC